MLVDLGSVLGVLNVDLLVDLRSVLGRPVDLRSVLGVLDVDLLGVAWNDVAQRPEAVLVGDVLDAGDGAVRVDELVAARLHVPARLRLGARVGKARLLPQNVVGRLEPADIHTRGSQLAANWA